MDVARYDSVAAMYAENFDYRSTPPGASLLDLAGDVEGLTALDLACGHGVRT